jgi:hypothetical protein
MPLVRISLMRGKGDGFGRKVGEVVYRAMVDTLNVPPRHRAQRRLHRDPDHAPQDVFISLVEVKKENWSFGNGMAQYVA